jgi:hypothetical protein
MGTTEVHRTLVKSPPELWAELSDQDALARLLSELGEIRIISTVAESVVHWESDEATGCALIKQAGWGTKVTLRATVTDPERITPEAPAAVLAAAPASPPAPVTAAHAPPPATPTPMTAAAQRGSLQPEQPPAQTAAPPTPQPAPVVSPPTPQPTPVVSPPTRAPDPVAHDTPAEQAEADVPDNGTPEPTRRGFLARLFGRRTPSHEQPDQPAPDGARAADTVAAAPDTPAAASAEDDGPQTGSPEPEPVRPTALEALEARFAARAPAPKQEGASQPQPAPRPEPTPQPQPAPQTEPEIPPLAAGTSPAGACAPETASRHGRPPDLSNELRRAEEIAADNVRAAPTEDQVQEILTGVLDRLGAAHHRPFSRA